MYLQLKDRHSTCKKVQKKKVCKNIDIEPRMLLVTGETRNNARTNTSHEVRVDIQTKGFWVRGHLSMWEFST